MACCCWLASVAGGALAAAALVVVIALSRPPVVPEELDAWPSLGYLYLQLLRAALRRKPARRGNEPGKPIRVRMPMG